MTYLEEIQQSANLLWTKALPLVAASEIKGAFSQWLGLAVEPLRVFGTHFDECMEGKLFLEDWIKSRSSSLHQQIELLSETVKAERHKEVREVLVASEVHRARQTRHELARQLCAQVLRDTHQTEAGILITVKPNMVEEFVQQLDLNSCPALLMWLSFDAAKQKSQGGGAPSLRCCARLA